MTFFTRIILSVTTAFSLLNVANADSVSTTPVGFTTTAVGANTIRALSVPFNNVPDYAAAVTSVNSGALTVTTTGAGWSTSPQAFAPFASNPHLIRMVSGAAVGRMYRIASNTTDTLTLLAGSDLTGVAANDTYQIFASPTLGSLFPNATGPAGPPPGITTHPTDATQADNILVRATSWITYYNDGTQWKRQGTDAPSNNVAITPDQGFVFTKRGGTTYNFTALGAVPITNLKTDFAANSIRSFSNQFPVTTMTLVGDNLVAHDVNGLDLDTLPGWNKNADSTIADNVLIRGSSWITYYYDTARGGPTNGNPGSWIRQGTEAINQNPTIPIGTSIVIVRRAGTTVSLNQALPYSLTP